MSDSDVELVSAAEPGAAAAAARAVASAASASAGLAASERASLASFQSLPWVEKWRPSTLDDLISQGDIIGTSAWRKGGDLFAILPRTLPPPPHPPPPPCHPPVRRLISANRLPHLLLYGPPGTGKTSTILAVAKEIYGEKWRAMTLELNASDDRGIDVVRDQIKSFAGTRKLFSTGVKLVVLDEADAMTQDAQFALRRVIEKYARNTRFCLICNYVSKIIPALQSRCTRFRFAPLARDEIVGRLKYIIDKEGLAARVQEDGIKAIMQLAGGDMRKVLNVLQAAASAYEVIDESVVYAVTGNPKPAEVKEAVRQLMAEPIESAYGCA